MLRRLFIFTFLLFPIVFASAQMNRNKDSLLVEFKKNPNDLEIISRLAQSYEMIQADSAIYYAQHLLTKSEKDWQFTARGYQTLGNSYLTKNEIEKAESYYLKAIEISRKNKGYYEEAFYEQALAQAYLNYGKAQEALELYEQSSTYFLEHSEAPQADYYLSVIFNGIGNSYNLIGLYALAIENFQQSLEYTEKTQDILSEAITYNSLATSYSSLKDYSKSIEYNQKSLEIFENIDYPLGDATVHLNLAESYFKNNQTEQSLDHLKKSEAILVALGTNYNLGEVYSLYGEIYHNESNYEKSNDYFQKALAIHSQSGALQYLSKTYVNIAKNNVAEGKNKEAEENLTNALEISRANQFPKEESEALEILLQLKSDEELKGYLHEFLMAHDTYLNAEKHQAVTAQEIKYETAKKETQLAQQDLVISKEKNQKTMAYSALIIFLLFAGAGYSYLKFKQRRNSLENQNRLLLLRQDLNRMELASVNQQLNPHEIKNLIAAISPEIQEKAPEAYRQMLKLFRLTKASLNSELTDSLENQIEQTDNYLSLMKTMLPSPLEYTIENQLENSDVKLPRLLLKNLVQNSVTHGISALNREGKILVRISQHDRFLHIVVDDNGKGIGATTPNKDGIGLSGYQRLFDLLNQKNSQHAELTIVDKRQINKGNASGTRVEIRIPEGYRYE